MMTIIVALIPGIAWGSVGLINTKMGGSAAQQTLGMTFGALVFGLLTLVCFVLPQGIALTPRIWVVGLLSGLVWAVGTAGQFLAIKAIGVSAAIPLSTAGQIVMNALLAATVLGEWHTAGMWLFGTLAIAAVVTGATLMTLRARGAAATSGNRKLRLHAYGYLAVSTAGYMMYFVLPNLLTKIGYISTEVKNHHHGIDYMTAIVAPQAIGQVLGALVIVTVVLRARQTLFAAPTWRNMVTGGVWAVGNLFMFISAANPRIGQATAATLSQMGIIVATFGGIYLLGEKKTSTQMVGIVIGSFCVVAGGMLIGNLSVFAH